jgi:acyl-CoA thioesterase-1
MPSFILSIADGTLFFIGLAMVVVADLLLLRFHTGKARFAFTLMTILGIILVVISAIPQPLWAYMVWFLPAASSLFLGNLTKPPRKLRILSGVLLLAATVGLFLAELPYHFYPRITVPRNKPIYVLGDSLSAGIGKEERCWPEVLGDITALHVVNLAKPGAKVRNVIEQADQIPQPGALVIVEIGGNDLMGGTDASDFREHLDRLLASLRANRHEVLLLELPLFPFQNAFGTAQRDLAAKHGVILLPKRLLTKVLSMEHGRLDGIHLSQQGHNALAEILAKVLQKEGEKKKGTF